MPTYRHVKWYLAAPTVVAATVVLVGAISTRHESACLIAVREPLSNHADLPGALARFSECSITERKIAYAELSLSDRRALWQEHLSSFLDPTSTLTPQQQATVRLVISRLDRYFDSPAKGRIALERDGLTAKRLKAEFGDSLGKAMFAILGKDERVLGHTSGETRVVIGKDGAPSIVYNEPRDSASTKTRIAYCSCSQTSDWCCHGTCGTMYEDCIVSFGCGTLWLYWCNGLCEVPTDDADRAAAPVHSANARPR